MAVDFMYLLELFLCNAVQTVLNRLVNVTGELITHGNQIRNAAIKEISFL